MQLEIDDSVLVVYSMIKGRHSTSTLAQVGRDAGET